MSLLNRQLLLQYDVAGPVLWHERLVLAHIQNEDSIVATPDQDVHYEELSLLNADLRGIRVKPSPHALPPGILVPLATLYTGGNGSTEVGSSTSPGG